MSATPQPLFLLCMVFDEEDKQDINRQIHELKAAGADKVIIDYEHGDAKLPQLRHPEDECLQTGEDIQAFKAYSLSIHLYPKELSCRHMLCKTALF